MLLLNVVCVIMILNYLSDTAINTFYVYLFISYSFLNQPEISCKIIPVCKSVQ